MAAKHDLTQRIAPQLDRHLVFPLLEFLPERGLYPEEDILKAKIAMAGLRQLAIILIMMSIIALSMVDYRMKSIRPDRVLRRLLLSLSQSWKTYRFRISNVGLRDTLNFRIQGHTMKLVEVEGTHTLQTIITSLDVHVGQSCSVLVTTDQPPRDYYIVASSCFTSQVLTTTAVLQYSNSREPVSGTPPSGPADVQWSLNQARSIRTNLTASGPRPNPQGSYHYGQINVSRTIRLSNSAAIVNGKQRYSINGVSFIPTDTPLKLADYFNHDDIT